MVSLIGVNTGLCGYYCLTMINYQIKDWQILDHDKFIWNARYSGWKWIFWIKIFSNQLKEIHVAKCMNYGIIGTSLYFFFCRFCINYLLFYFHSLTWWQVDPHWGRSDSCWLSVSIGSEMVWFHSLDFCSTEVENWYHPIYGCQHR